MRCPILNFLPLLVLGVLSNMTLGGIHGSLWVPQTLSKRSLNSTQGKRSLTAWFFLCLNWCQQKLILLWMNEAANEIRLVSKVPTVLTWSLYCLRAFLVACNWLQLGGTNPCRTLSLSEGLLWCTWRKPKFFLWGLQAHLNRCAWAWRDVSTSARMWCHCYEAW